jgi:hypothetical protein
MNGRIQILVKTFCLKLTNLFRYVCRLLDVDLESAGGVSVNYERGVGSLGAGLGERLIEGLYVEHSNPVASDPVL